MRSLMIWSVALGGAVGSVARYVLGTLIQRSSGTIFPVWTLVINVSGSLILGFLMRYLVEGVSVSPETRVLLTTGLIGGYTTFSTFSYETATFIEQGDWRRSTLYIALSVGLSLAGTFGGIAIARAVIARSRGV